MKAIIERLSGELSVRYLLYIERIMVDIWSEAGEVEIRCGFALRTDHQLRTVTFKVPANAAKKDADREAVVGAVFKQLEMLIDRSIADQDLAN